MSNARFAHLNFDRKPDDYAYLFCAKFRRSSNRARYAWITLRVLKQFNIPHVAVIETTRIVIQSIFSRSLKPYNNVSRFFKLR